MQSLTTLLAFGAAMAAAVGLLIALAPSQERIRLRIEDRGPRR